MPRDYTIAGTTRWNNPWTAEQKDLLEQLVALKRPWDVIAEKTGHPKMSCQAMMSYIRRGRKRPPGEGAGRIMQERRRKTMQAPLPQIIAIVSEPSARQRSLHTLVADAELRARIQIQGPNGLFGDPLPGRSALDRKREGVLT